MNVSKHYYEITCFVIIVYSTYKLLKKTKYMIPTEKVKHDDYSQKNLISTVIFYQYVVLFSTILYTIMLRSIFIYVQEVIIGMIWYYFDGVQTLCVKLLKTTIFSMILVIPLHFIVFVLYRYGFKDRVLLIDPQDEMKKWIYISGSITFLSLIFLNKFNYNVSDDDCSISCLGNQTKAVEYIKKNPLNEDDDIHKYFYLSFVVLCAYSSIRFAKKRGAPEEDNNEKPNLNKTKEEEEDNKKNSERIMNMFIQMLIVIIIALNN